MPKTYLADKQTLDTINTKVGANSDAESGTPTTLFAGLKNIIKGIIELKNLLSDGKTRVANAITGKGISTATNATFATMANNINAITTLTQGTGDANVSAYDIVSGKTAYARGGKITGTLPEYGAYTAGQSVAYGSDSLYVRIPQGAYRSNGGSGYPEITVHQNAVASSIGLSSDKIKAGVNIMGVVGSLKPYSVNTYKVVHFVNPGSPRFWYYLDSSVGTLGTLNVSFNSLGFSEVQGYGDSNGGTGKSQYSQISGLPTNAKGIIFVSKNSQETHWNIEALTAFGNLYSVNDIGSNWVKFYYEGTTYQFTWNSSNGVLSGSVISGSNHEMVCLNGMNMIIIC